MTSENNQNNNPQISVAAQYVKDISFENPSAPNSLRQTDERPSINVSVDVKAQPLGGEGYEVSLKISATAKKSDEVVFISEVEYAGVFVLQNISEGELQPALLIFCPSLLFPYARRIISDLTRDGGFPALMLDPIDFGKLYQQRLDQNQ
jgi:preprotein translocase subunit SecB